MTARRDGLTVIVDPRQVAELMRSERGPVVRRMIDDAELVKRRAQELVGVHEPVPGERRARRPGTLRDSIVKRVVRRGDTVVVQVGSDDPIALLHHEGTQPHLIRARRAPLLVFFWRKVGRVVRTKQVRHPGTRPNRYLLDALDVLRRRYR